MVPKIEDGPKKKRNADDFWDDFEDLDSDSEEDDFYNEGDWEESEEE
jgi:hypothetical protein